MKIDLREFLRNKEIAIDLDNELNLSFVNDLSKDNVVFDKVNVSGTLINLSGILEFKGKADINYSTFCARCLESVVHEGMIEICENFHKQSTSIEADEYTYDGNELDLSKALADNILMSLPMRHLCSENCNGLCSECGINLNETKCVCEVVNVDPRLAKLSDLFK